MKKYLLMSFSLHFSLLLVALLRFVFWQDTKYSFDNKIEVYIYKGGNHQKKQIITSKYNLHLHDPNVKKDIIGVYKRKSK